MNSSRLSFGDQCRRAKIAAPLLAALPEKKRNQLLIDIAAKLRSSTADILKANQQDTVAATKMLSAGSGSRAMLQRLTLSEAKAKGLAVYAETVAALASPLHTVDYRMQLHESLILERIKCPLGLIATIFESRPEVVVQIACLAIKSGNAFILKGGTEAAQSNLYLFDLIQQVMQTHGVAETAVLAETREETRKIMEMKGVVDLIIPRGSNQFVEFIRQNSHIPVLGHSDGICHIYVDQTADREKAQRICLDAKTDYPSACNAVETILFHETQSRTTVAVLHALTSAGVRVHVCEKTAVLLASEGIDHTVKRDNDWAVEYSDLDVSVCMVPSVDAAVEHINRFGSGHTDAIITEDVEIATRFCALVDSASVFHNASTRFSDGYVFGFGAEVGISTEKLHARGPVGIDGLFTTKYRLQDRSKRGATRAEFTAGSKQFLHHPLPLP